MTAGRSGCLVPAGMLIVPPKWARLLDALVDDATPRHFRRNGLPMPDEFAAWLADLHDVAEATPPPAEPSRPTAWFDVPTAAQALGVSERRVRQIVATKQFRARRDGRRRWLVAADDVVDEVEARSDIGSDRNRIGFRCPGDASQSVPSKEVSHDQVGETTDP
jgi:hypothetical protein